MTPQLSPALDVAALRQAFATRRRLHVPGVLAPDSAESIAAALEAFDGWKVSVSAGGEFFELPLKGRVAAERGVTGDDRIDFVDAQATRYRPGQVLTGHDDAAEGKNRLYAYVLNLTRDWRADWGGVLAFEGADGHIEAGFVPAFNALNLFAVPMRHAVTQVASFAPRDRLSITGWLRSNQAV
jgi:hypothetical protein